MDAIIEKLSRRRTPGRFTFEAKVDEWDRQRLVLDPKGRVFLAPHKGARENRCSLSNCRAKVSVSPTRPGQLLGVRCLYCLRVLCYPCAKRHFEKGVRKSRRKFHGRT